MPIKILSNYSDKNSKLTKQGHGIVQWRAGSNQQEIKQSCKGANCLFLKGGAFMNPVTGKKFEIGSIPGKKIVTVAGTSMEDPTYHDSQGNQLMKVDSCFAISGTPYLASYRSCGGKLQPYCRYQGSDIHGRVRLFCCIASEHNRSIPGEKDRRIPHDTVPGERQPKDQLYQLRRQVGPFMRCQDTIESCYHVSTTWW